MFTRRRLAEKLCFSKTTVIILNFFELGYVKYYKLFRLDSHIKIDLINFDYFSNIKITYNYRYGSILIN